MKYLAIAVLAMLMLGVSTGNADESADQAIVGPTVTASSADPFIVKYIGQLEQAIDYAEWALAEPSPFLKWYYINEADDRVLEAEHTHREAVVAAAIAMTLRLSRQ